MGDPAPLLGTDAAPIPPGAAAEWFAGAKGARLRAAIFPTTAAKPRGSVVVSGGRTEPIEKYFEVATELTARGFVVLIHDWRGQGLSARMNPNPMKGHARGYADFVADYAALLTAFESRLPQPWLAISHSMGGCLTALALAKGETRFAAAALSAPMFGLHLGPLSPIMARGLALGMKSIGLGGSLIPGGHLTPEPAGFEDNILTHDPVRYERNVDQIVRHPDLALGAPTFGWLDFAFAAIAELKKGKGVTQVQTPVTVFGAGDDKIADTDQLREVTARFPKGRFIEVEGAYHEILQETDEHRAVFWRVFDEMAAVAAP